MDKNTTKMFLEVDTSQIEVKSLLRKDFFELSMKAISSANPNRNNSWFTKESMEKSLDSFRNKPILGYFENGDFVSHNGDWQHDSETDMDYWDTLNKGERILGIIRESDDIKIIQDKNGLYWITLTCALWTQYSFKQVKRLIKDAKRAQQTGETAKNISVEIDVLDFEELENGVKKINAFNLVGITILGSRHGIKVQPGIEDAGLSVTDIMGKEVYSVQEKALRLAYAQLDDNPVGNKEESQMEKEENKKPETSENLSANEEVHKDDLSNEGVENPEKDQVGACTKCGKNPCECEKEKGEEKTEEGAQKDMDKHLEEDDHKDEGGGHDGDDKDHGHDDDDHDDDDDHGKDEGHEDPKKECGQNCITYTNTDSDDKSFAISFPIGIDSDTLSGPAILYDVEKDPKFIGLQEKYEVLLKEKEALSKELSEVKEKVQIYEHKEFLEKAYALIKSAKLNEETTLQFNKACEEYSITNLDELKTKIGLALFELRSAEKVEEPEEKKEEHNVSFSAPVNKPNTESLFSDKESKKTQKDIWEKLREYNSK
jgi:hypothetical protein